MKIRPTEDRILIQTIEGPTKSGHIFIPDNAQQKPQKAKVLAVGPGRYEKGERKEVICKVGETILFGKYSGVEVEVDNQIVHIIRETDIICIIEDDNGNQ
jgi:chaperonin GroES